LWGGKPCAALSSAKRSAVRSTKQREALKSSLRSKREKFLRAFYKKRLNKCAALSSAKRIKQARSAQEQLAKQA